MMTKDDAPRKRGVETMHHSRPMTIAMAILWVLSWSPAARAETLTLTADGEYVMGEGETMAVGSVESGPNHRHRPVPVEKHGERS